MKYYLEIRLVDNVFTVGNPAGSIANFVRNDLQGTNGVIPLVDAVLRPQGGCHIAP